MHSVSFSVLSADEFQPVLPRVAELRLNIFREYPYLYDGTYANEEEYLGRYLQSADFTLILAKDGQRIVGASTCLPLSQEINEIRAPLLQAGYDVEEVMYLGESVLSKAYRGLGIGKAFFHYRETQSHKLGKSYASFCAVERPASHPLRPQNYSSLQTFWRKQGYNRLDRIQASLFWKDVLMDKDTEKKLTFWIKKL